MNSLHVRTYEIKTARNKEIIPVINGAHLHSSYDPSKEASMFIQRYAETLKTKNEVLVLGLGFAYHVNELSNLLTQLHGKNFSIVVIEPNNETYQDCVKEGLLKTENVTVYTGLDAKDFYIHDELIHFLLKKPAVIAHPASFNLYQAFFKSFLSYEAPKTIGQMSKRVVTPELQEYLSKFSKDATLDQVAEMAFSQNSKLKELDYLLLALHAMTSRSSKMNQEAGDI
jgi:hypothetical protein